MAKKRTRRRAATRSRSRRGRPSRLASASLAELQEEIQRRRGALQARRDELISELEAIDNEIGAMVDATPRPRRGRPPGSGASTTARRRGRPAGKRGGPARKRGRPPGTNAGGGLSLVESLHRVLQGRTMSVTDVTSEVQRAGYKTKSANFRTIVNQALTANPDRFKKVARGQYTSK